MGGGLARGQNPFSFASRSVTFVEVEEAEVVQAIGDDEKAPLRSILFQRLALVCVENERKFESRSGGSSGEIRIASTVTLGSPFGSFALRYATKLCVENCDLKAELEYARKSSQVCVCAGSRGLARARTRRFSFRVCVSLYARM